jgi:hypothetical protein
MAVVENRATEIGDVIRIETDVPIIGLISLNSFVDNTEGESIGSTTGILPQYFDENGVRVPYTRMTQVGVDRYVVLSGNKIAFQNVNTGAWTDDFPQVSLPIQSMSSDGTTLYVFSNVYNGGTGFYDITVTDIDIPNRLIIQTTTISNTGAISGWVTSEVVDDKIYYWARPSGSTWSLYAYNIVTLTINKVNDYFEPTTQPFIPTIDAINKKIYYTYRPNPVIGERQLGVYEIVGDQYTLLQVYTRSIDKITYSADRDEVHSLIALSTSPAIVKVVVCYDAATNTWTTNNGIAPPSLNNLNGQTYYNGKLYFTGPYYFTDVYDLDTDTFATEEGGDARLFEKQFRYSIDSGFNFSPWLPLNEVNIQNITVSGIDQFVIEVTYKRIGTDATGELVFNSLTLGGDFEELGYPIYDTTIFKKLFEVNESNI